MPTAARRRPERHAPPSATHSAANPDCVRCRDVLRCREVHTARQKSGGVASRSVDDQEYSCIFGFHSLSFGLRRHARPPVHSERRIARLAICDSRSWTGKPGTDLLEAAPSMSRVVEVHCGHQCAGRRIMHGFERAYTPGTASGGPEHHASRLRSARILPTARRRRSRGRRQRRCRAPLPPPAARLRSLAGHSLPRMCRAEVSRVARRALPGREWPEHPVMSRSRGLSVA